MAGTIPLSLTQQFDEFGEPLSGGLLYIIQAGTVATPQQPYQDAALSILQPNPIVLDAAGRIPQFFLADGYIKVRLTDSTGVVQLAADNILVIGPSAGGGGGGGVDPTTIFQTGMVAIFYGIGSVAGFVRCNARSIGNALSGATERANADTQALWIYLYNADSNLTVSGGRTGNALNDYNAGKQLTMPDWRGRTIAGLDDMGNTPAGRLTPTYWGMSGIALGQASGDEKAPLMLRSDLPNVSPTFSGIAGTVNVSGSVNGVPYITNTFNTGTAPNLCNLLSTTNYSFSASGSFTPQGTVQSLNGNVTQTQAKNVQPTMLATIYMKL